MSCNRFLASDLRTHVVMDFTLTPDWHSVSSTSRIKKRQEGIGNLTGLSIMAGESSSKSLCYSRSSCYYLGLSVLSLPKSLPLPWYVVLLLP
mmetsp:Transcript_42597/g.134109  ORF Transcript_42597/g.134109 Transcript_42597/m.134109 type:complete len:92 (-) Transcript_42597:63-338(-)